MLLVLTKFRLRDVEIRFVWSKFVGKRYSHTGTVKTSAFDLSEESAPMPELVITSGKRQKNVTCQP